MVRYTRQHDEYTCGPIAILNALKWAGKNVSLKNLKYLKRITKCQCDSDPQCSGMADKDMNLGLKRVGKGIFRTNRIRAGIKDIEKHLKNRGAVLANLEGIFDRKNIITGHYVLVVGVSNSGKTFKVVNFTYGETIESIRRNTLTKYRRSRFRFARPLLRAWFLIQI